MSNTTIEFYGQHRVIPRKVADRRTKITGIIGEQVLVTHKV